MPEIAESQTPMMRQYLAVKAKVKDAILFFRLGDFYEMFFEDALVASEALQITLTSRSKGDGKVPMCGVPYHAARGYVAKLLEKGFKVAICDQVEEPGKGTIVRREVTRLVTPGMVFDDQVLDPREASFLGAAYLGPRGGGLALLDASTGDLRCGEASSDERLVEELRRAGVRELLLPAGGDPDRLDAIERAVGVPVARREDLAFAHADERLRRHFAVKSLDGFGVGGMPLALAATAAALAYLEETQRAVPLHIDRISKLPAEDALEIDEATRANLELERTIVGGRKKGSLLALIDRTVTPPGGRRLAEWLRYPLAQKSAIAERHDAVEELFGSSVVREEIAAALRPVTDMERLLSRLVLGQGNARDVRSLAGSLLALPALYGQLAARSTAMLCGAAVPLRGLEDLASLLDCAVAEEPPATLSEVGIIRRGYSPDLDAVIAVSEDARGFIAAMEVREREKTGIPSLKVRYNRVFGYYLEVTKPNLHLVPSDWERRQTTVNGERFVTGELKSFEETVLGAEEKRLQMEKKLFEELREKVTSAAARLRGAAHAVSTVDALVSLARVAAERGYVRPTVDESETLEILDGRHPVVEALLPEGPTGFVPNDLAVAARGGPDCESRGALLVVTGPNMAGKSTVLRQTALVVILAQMGSFVPARRARIGLVDRVFTRVGASDDLARGRSTFMVEMTETAAILHNATRRSLVVLDEIGRGTSTFDGVSIAWAVAEYLHDTVGCRTIFATHYHELQDLARERPAVRNLTVAVQEVNDRVVFLRKLVPGGASRSYGIEVAKLAGLPGGVILRAREILKNLEALEVDEGGHTALAKGRKRKNPGPAQLAFFAPVQAVASPGATVDPALAELATVLRVLDPDALRPIDALKLVAEWKARLTKTDS